MIEKKLASISAELSVVGKDLSVGARSASYKAVSEGAILAAVKPLEERYKVYSYPASREIVFQDVIKSVGDGGKERLTFVERVRTVYRFVDLEDGSSIDVVSFGDGIDAGDKSVGKAMTYSDKYALMKAYKIETGDDPDKEASEPIYTSAPKEKPQPEPKLSPEDPASEKQLNYLRALIQRKGMDEAIVRNTLGKTINQLTIHEAGEMIKAVQNAKPIGRTVNQQTKQETPLYDDDLPF